MNQKCTKRRKVVTRSGARVRGYFNSFKSENRIPWESFIEHDALLVWEFAQDVASMDQYQQLVTVSENDIEFNAYPDFQIQDHHGDTKIIEVKSDADLQRDSVNCRLQAISRRFAAEGITYEVFAEKEIRQQPRLTTLFDLLPLRRKEIKHELLQSDVVRNVLSSDHPLNFAELTERVGDDSTALRLLATGLVEADFSKGITRDLVVAPITEGSPC